MTPHGVRLLLPRITQPSTLYTRPHVLGSLLSTEHRQSLGGSASVVCGCPPTTTIWWKNCVTFSHVSAGWGHPVTVSYFARLRFAQKHHPLEPGEAGGGSKFCYVFGRQSSAKKKLTPILCTADIFLRFTSPLSRHLDFKNCGWDLPL